MSNKEFRLIFKSIWRIKKLERAYSLVKKKNEKKWKEKNALKAIYLPRYPQKFRGHNRQQGAYNSTPEDPTYLHVYLEVHNPLCWTYRSNGYTPTQQAIPCKYLISTLVIGATVSHVYILLQVLWTKMYKNAKFS